jgi:hypothetical protein
MKAFYTILILLFSISISKAQVTDSTTVQNQLKIPTFTKKIDTTGIVNNFEALKIDTLYFKGMDLSKIDSSKIAKVYINFSLLDSLLKPFYLIDVHDITEDTIFTPKFRRSVNVFTQDTSYIPFPVAKDPIPVKHSFGIDTLKIFPTAELPVDIVTQQQVRPLAWWENANSIAFDFNEVAFKNWTSGGENSISGLLKIYFSRKFQKKFTYWKTEVSARYGLNKQEEREWRKTDDQIRINSTFGYRRKENSNWYYTAKLNFRTQFTDGYKYPNTEDPISKFFAPAYLFVGAGTQFNSENEHFFIYFSPVTFKSTFVLDEALSNDGAYGVEPGKKIRREFGASIQSNWDTEIFKNVAMINRIGLYSDYLNSFGSIDVDWELVFKFKISKFFEANIGAHLIYDDDILFGEDTNGDGENDSFDPRVQLKQQLGIGVLYKF